MKIFLDSSFFFPFISVEVKNCPKEAIQDLINQDDFQIYRSEISIFELSAKGTKFVVGGLLDIDDVIDGLNTIQQISQIKIIPIYLSEIQILATKLRQSNPDFIDCLIVASAALFSDIFITIDETIKTNFNEYWNNYLREKNPEFQILMWDEFRQFYL
jgi:PIN domain nuclease of toxin-antitoxin system